MANLSLTDVLVLAVLGLSAVSFGYATTTIVIAAFKLGRR